MLEPFAARAGAQRGLFAAGKAAAFVRFYGIRGPLRWHGSSTPIRAKGYCMKCSEVMKTKLECANVNAPVAEIARRMRDRNIGFMPVCGDDGVVSGAITDRDLALRVLADERAPETTRVGDVMSPGIVSCSADWNLTDAELLMSKHKVSRIVVVDGGRHPIGVVSLSDVAEVETGRTASAVLRSVSQREARG
jgi:CBS domain-containing protein